jgi:sulfur-carrier protein adenylyltransferase/sulfurtransferase
LGEPTRTEASPEIAPVDASRSACEGAVLVDVRARHERQTGAPAGARLLDREDITRSIHSIAPDPATPLLLICNRGVSSLALVAELRALGYRDVRSVAGGLERWRRDGLPMDEIEPGDDLDRERYARHLAMPDIGEDGQRRLLASRVVLVGAGGLGSPAAFYLAAAGVGHLTLVDGDVVDRSNLQRQVLHVDGAVGTPKVDSARARLEALNPSIDLTTRQLTLDAGNVEQVLRGHDLVIDGSDNFATRYLVNDACVRLGIPDVHGSVFRFEGQVTVFWPGRPGEPGPCYRCLYPEATPAELAPSCAEAGVLGILPGVIGMLQATEALKLLLGLGESLVGRLLHYDALAASFATYRIEPDPACICRR